MKEIGSSLAQLVLVIIFTITLAVSTAALSQWTSPDEGTSSVNNQRIEQGETAAPGLSASVAR